MAAKSDFATAFKAMTIQEQTTVLEELTELHNNARDAKRKELIAELAALGGMPVEPAKRTRSPKTAVEGDARAAVKPQFKGPNGETWAGRGATPRWLSALEEAGHNREQYRIKD